MKMNSVPLCSIVLVLLVSLIKQVHPIQAFCTFSLSLQIFFSKNITSASLQRLDGSSIRRGFDHFVWQKEGDGLSKVQEKEE